MNELSDRLAAQTRERGVLGHPKGLFWLTGSEYWERFSYYGMQALLVLYMTHRLLLPGQVEKIWLFGPFRRGIEAVYGPLSVEALASAIFGLYAGLVYLTPILGGIVADRLNRTTATVTAGALLMALGHFLMAFTACFLPALACLLIGVGCFKGNIAAQVGELYEPGDLRRANGFQIYMIGIQAAVIISPFVCGTLGETVGWHWGFGAAGVGMVIGLVIYLLGRPHFPQQKRRAPRAAAAKPRLTRVERLRVLALVGLVPVLAIGAVGNMQIFNAYLLWGEAHFDMTWFGHEIPTSWLVSLDAVVSTGSMVLSLAFWQWWARRRREPDELTKIILGTSLGILGALTLALAAFYARGGRVSLGWAVMFELFNDFGFANVFPVGLALFSRAAPQRVAGTMIGVYYLNLCVANNIVGWLGGLLDKMPGVQFWLLHAALIGSSALILTLLGRFARSLLEPD